MCLTYPWRVHRVPLCKLAGSGVKSSDAPRPTPKRLTVVLYPSCGLPPSACAPEGPEIAVFGVSPAAGSNNRGPGLRQVDVVGGALGPVSVYVQKESDHGRQQGEPGSSW